MRRLPTQYLRRQIDNAGADVFVWRGNFEQVPFSMLGTGIPVGQLYSTAKVAPLVANFDIFAPRANGIQSGGITLYPLINR